MKCPKCGATMQKATAADVYLCLSCGTRARLVVDEMPAEPQPQIVPMPYPVAPWPQPYSPPIWTPIWTSPNTTDVPTFDHTGITCSTEVS